MHPRTTLVVSGLVLAVLWHCSATAQTPAVAPAAPESPGAGHDTEKNIRTPTATPVAEGATTTMTPQLPTPRSKPLELPEVGT